MVARARAHVVLVSEEEGHAKRWRKRRKGALMRPAPMVQQSWVFGSVSDARLFSVRQHIGDRKEKRVIKFKSNRNGRKAEAEQQGTDKVEDDKASWRWWEDEEPRNDAKKRKMWHTLEHRGPLFAPPYKRLPSHVHFFSTTAFNENFLRDWRKCMNRKEAKLIT
ncbi:hypothetical protein MRX96_042526 [Rhipicephalus microplus]